MFSSLIIAFAMYSKIPMPRVDWNEKNMKYALVFFPVVGAAVGGIFCLAAWLFGSVWSGASPLLAAAVLTAVPILVTGGFHMDGFLDTIDARRSFAPKEKKLEILKDPNAGAFAVIYACIWFLLYFGFQAQLLCNLSDGFRLVGIVALGFIYSRALSGFAVVTFQGARKSGLLASFADGAEKRPVRITMVIYAAAAAAGMIGLSPIAGAVTAAAGLLVFIYYRWMAYKEFGGITGDLAGYFVQMCELAMLIAAVAAGGIF